jgi:RNA-directed DNA polymerase
MSSLPPLLTRSDVARYLGVDLKHITWWVWALRERRRYYEFPIERRTGGRPRLIRAPIKPIKDLQHGLLPLLDEAYTARSHVHGFVQGRSPITNATVHRNQRWILRVDLTDFFPSIHFGRVFGLFRADPFDYPDPVASLLAQICCHRNELPQGAPTSPVISNLVCRRLDKQLAAFAKAQHCHYTRYADDICFSSGRRMFPEGIATIVKDVPVLSSELRSIISTNDFVVNESKTRLMPRRQRQRVTGLVVNERINVPREFTRHLRAVLYIWAKYGQPDAEAAFERRFGGRNWPSEKKPPEFRLVIRGQLQYLGVVRGYDRIYQRLATLMTSCDPSFVATAPTWPEPGEVLYATEGPSDPLHLDAALRALRSVGDFTELSLRQLSHKPPKNDDQLWRWLQQEKDIPSQIPRLGIFDADSSFASAIGPTGWSHLGNGTVAVVLSSPPWHPSGKPFCIELLHQRDVLRREDVDGRRIFVRDEFDSNGLSGEGRFQMKHRRAQH